MLPFFFNEEYCYSYIVISSLFISKVQFGTHCQPIMHAQGCDRYVWKTWIDVKSVIFPPILKPLILLLSAFWSQLLVYYKDSIVGCVKKFGPVFRCAGLYWALPIGHWFINLKHMMAFSFWVLRGQEAALTDGGGRCLLLMQNIPEKSLQADLSHPLGSQGSFLRFCSVVLTWYAR